MSACADFADHVWKPGSCKNCFHPLSAHAPNDPELMIHSKPTIAVRPTMINTLQEQRVQAALKRALDPASLLIESSRCSAESDAACEVLSCVSLEENGIHHPSAEELGTEDETPHEARSRNPAGATSPEASITTSPMSPDSFNSQSDSPCSFRSTDSLQSPRGEPHKSLEDTEPIYAESTKRRTRAENSSGADPSIREPQRTTISILAEDHSRTFFLRSPDSSVSAHWSPFSSVSAPPDVICNEPTPKASMVPKAQCSPPVPPKIKPRLGTSSLSLAPSPQLLALPPAWWPTHCSAPSLTLDAGGLEESESREAPSTGDTSSCGRRPGVLLEKTARDEPPPPPPPPKKLQRGSRACRDSSGALQRHKQKPNVFPQQTSDRNQLNGFLHHVIHTFCSRRSLRALVNLIPSERAAQEVCFTPALEFISRSPSHSSSGGFSQALYNYILFTDCCGAVLSVLIGRERAVSGAVLSVLIGRERSLALQSSSVESLSQSLQGVSCCSSGESLQPADSVPRSSPSPCPNSPFGSAPSSPQPPLTPHLHAPPHPLQPPPLPQKKQVGRTISVPSNGDSNMRAICSSGSSPALHMLQDPAAGLRSEPDVLHRLSSGLNLHATTSGSRAELHSFQTSSPVSGSRLKLHALLSNMDSRECVYSRLGGLYAESLRRLALKCEEHFTSEQRSALKFDESNWSLFKLTCSKPSCVSGDAVYYSASCASQARSAYAVKICKGQTAESNQAHLYGLSVQENLPPHFSLQQDCGHFIACVPHSMLPGDERASRVVGTRAALPGPDTALRLRSPSEDNPMPPGEDSTSRALFTSREISKQGVSSGSAGGGSLASEQERVVVITPEVPHQSVADFVREWEPFHRAQPEVYERRVCFLLLQLCSGLEHLKAHGVTHRDLYMENLLLVQHGNPASTDRHQQSLPRLLITSFGKAKQRHVDDITISANPQFKRDHARLAPEIISAAQYLKFDEFQTGILIYELLHCPNPFENIPSLRRQEFRCEELPLIPSVSIYSPGLQRLAQLLLEPDPGRRISIQEAKRILQALLWGPRRELLDQPWLCGGQWRSEALLNWLDVKRALLMMKFAERSLESERNAELEDWLCCQYFSGANPKALCQTAELLYCAPYADGSDNRSSV
ncbi:hypothetical protein DNTS_010116 [Danionella cerebrum]|uniref:Protein kinase domain-containing protein n=1 Tax=Danionella cerebrum TaxID=2873325 RepID=A0A553MM43_9TELE|nr:hypothetical protein DNTS_010116 [Danionella translucida]